MLDKRIIFLFLSMTVLLSSLLPAAEPAREFTATAVIENAQGTREMPVTLVIRKLASAEDIKGLHEVLTRGGQGALLSALTGRQDGQLRLGGLHQPLALVVAEELDSGDFRYIFLSPRRIRVEESTFGADSIDYPFGIAVFTMGDFSGEDGVLYPAAALSIDENGHVEVQGYGDVEGELVDITMK